MNYNRLSFSIYKLRIDVSLCLGLVFGVALSGIADTAYISIGPVVIVVRW